MWLSPVLIVSNNGKSFVLRFRRVGYMNVTNRQTHRQIEHATCEIGIPVSRIYAKATMLDKNTDGNAQYRTPGPITT